MIEIFNPSQLRNAEFISYGRDILALLKEQDLPGFGLQTSVNHFENDHRPAILKFDMEKDDSIGDLKDLRNSARESYGSVVHFQSARHTVQPKNVSVKLRG